MDANISLTALLVCCLVAVIYSAPSTSEISTSQTLDLLMPGVKPQKPDTYLCQAFKVEDAHAYITSFDPTADAHIAHHILLYGCDVPGGTPGTPWNCGEMASSGHNQFDKGPVCQSGMTIIYAWAMDAPKLTLPPDVSFDVGQETGTKYLVLQVHYKNVTKFLPPQNGEDKSGLTLETSSKPTKKSAGVYYLLTGGYIPPHSIEYFEAACPYDAEIEINPFAFRTHAHALGRVISGYRIRDGEWTEIGRKDPRLPEMFYNATTEKLTVKKGDILAARCTMENGLDHLVAIGNTQNDEMCNFYIMYYVESAATLSDYTCFTPGPPLWYWSDYRDQGKLNIKNVPDTASVIPGSDKPLIRNTTRTNSLQQQVHNDVNADELAYLMSQLSRDDQGEELAERAWLGDEGVEQGDEGWPSYMYENMLYDGYHDQPNRRDY